MSKTTEAIVKEEMQSIVLDRPHPDPTNDFRVKVPPPCEGCGGPAHGPVNGAIQCLTEHMRSARALLGSVMPRSCVSCGEQHRAVDQLISCLEDGLKRARAREGVGVSAAEFKANQEQSRHFEHSRGKNKKGGGG